MVNKYLVILLGVLTATHSFPTSIEENDDIILSILKLADSACPRAQARAKDLLLQVMQQIYGYKPKHKIISNSKNLLPSLRNQPQLAMLVQQPILTNEVPITYANEMYWNNQPQQELNAYREQQIMSAQQPNIEEQYFPSLMALNQQVPPQPSRQSQNHINSILAQYQQHTLSNQPQLAWLVQQPILTNKVPVIHSNLIYLRNLEQQVSANKPQDNVPASSHLLNNLQGSADNNQPNQKLNTAQEQQQIMSAEQHKNEEQSVPTLTALNEQIPTQKQLISGTNDSNDVMHQIWEQILSAAIPVQIVAQETISKNDPRQQIPNFSNSQQSPINSFNSRVNNQPKQTQSSGQQGPGQQQIYIQKPSSQQVLVLNQQPIQGYVIQYQQLRNTN